MHRGRKSRGAAAILLEIGVDMARFPSAGHRISWATLCPRNDDGAGKRRSTRVRPGPPWLNQPIRKLDRLGFDITEIRDRMTA